MLNKREMRESMSNAQDLFFSRELPEIKFYYVFFRGGRSVAVNSNHLCMHRDTLMGVSCNCPKCIVT